MKAAFWFAAIAVATALAAEPTLPRTYFLLLEAGAAKVEARLNAEPSASLKSLESQSAWRHFGYAILAPAVLYSKKHAANPRYRDRRMLELTLRIGDLLAREDENGSFEPRLDSDWDTYMWLEAYRLLDQSRTKRSRPLEASISKGTLPSSKKMPRSAWTSPGISLRSSAHRPIITHSGLPILSGRTRFGRNDWVQLGARILRRFAIEEQSPDGYWGEHNNSGPTSGYDYLTLTGVALYYEHSEGSAVLPALRRATDFHKNFTLLDGAPADVINDRNRRWGVSRVGAVRLHAFQRRPGLCGVPGRLLSAGESDP